MKKIIEFILLVVGCMLTTDGYAQKVDIQGKNTIIIDVSGLPNTKKERKPRLTSEATNSQMGGNFSWNLGSIYQNSFFCEDGFQISSPNEEIQTDWRGATNYCETLRGQSLNLAWRVPTQRELQLMYILSPELGTEGLEPVNRYWSVTEYGADSAWALYAQNGYSYAPSKTDRLFVRCVRDVF